MELHRPLSFLLIFLVSIHLSQAQDPQSGWDFTYPGDRFTEDALLDLSYLNEETAGENGFIRLSENGESFVNEQGEIRFWAVNGGTLVRDHDPNLTDRGLQDYARFMAKMGVNMMRFHGQMFSQSNNVNDPNRSEADNIWRVVAAMKEEGIYTTISPFWPAHMEDIPASWNLGDYVGNTDPWGLLYFDEDFRNAYKSWVTYLYTETNPHTGIALKDDPAVGLIQILNEDGVFFWTIGGVQPSLARLMQQQFFDWTTEKYGTIAEALDAWNQTQQEGDNIGEGLLGMINIWFASDDPNVPTPTPGFKQRLDDQMQFFAETQRDVYQELYDHYRDMGCQQLINASNWKTASSSHLLDLERWTALPTEVMASNRYYSPGHFGPNNGWRIERLHHYQGESAMFYPHRLPINAKQVKGKPFLITESGWNLPHKYQAEGPFLISAYQSLTGIDSYYWFSPSSINYEDDPYWPYFGQINGEEPMFRWTISTPGQIGMFPANALAYRMGYIQQGTPIVQEERTFESLVAREIPLITEERSFDPNRDSYSPVTMNGDTELSPLTYLGGPVSVSYEGNLEEEFISPQLDSLINISEKQLHSITGELTWNYQQGICILDAPKAQGICGFPEDRAYNLTDVTIQSTNDYVVVNVVSMDNEPIQNSSKLLVQVGTVYQPTGWEEVETTFSPEEGATPVNGYQIESLGRMPWKSANTEVEISFKNISVKHAWQLDAAGYMKDEIPVEIQGNETRLTLPSDVMYVVLETEALTTDANSIAPSDQRVIVYPNPGNGTFSLEIPQTLRYKSVEVLSLNGQRLATFDPNAEHTYTVSLATGTYIVRVLNDHNRNILSQKIWVK